ncbi:hypothetical protein VCUG_01958 [Vavraia culicis subsp. floridensis]|uniref:Uncharacterized protein n=1 Tax=Vavraia culicis (isolate floridensis) TaxID=948595 RepID=L2GTV5_VAVCU|nr:uncharacterized protein VCUG_01958 [Vavraia culicis subsp. floridensis]ELA46525.2 hypothetical protein VCUG_01958 [Vavraia culicis subsp. floridensis]
MKSVTDMKIKDMKGIMIDKTPIKAKNGQLIADMESSIPRENLSPKISQPKDTRSPILSGSNCIVPASTTKENDVRQSHDCKLKIDGSSSHEPKDVTQTKVYGNIQNNAMSTGNCPFTKKLSGDSVEKTANQNTAANAIYRMQLLHVMGWC